VIFQNSMESQHALRSLIATSLPTSLKRSLKRVIYASYVHAFWSKTSNWGDALNPVLIQFLSGKPVRFAQGVDSEKHIVIGSILSTADARTEVWGSGFIRAGESVVAPPRAIHALRGPLSHAEIRKSGIEAPEVFGDPALLLPYFFNPEIRRRYEVGIVPHYADKAHPWLRKFRGDSRILIVDVEGDIFEFVRAIKSCEIVLSSSLHGLICADAYAVPSRWIELSMEVIGEGFKFRDYFTSAQRQEAKPIRPSEGTPLSHVTTQAKYSPPKIDLHELVRCCPFVKRGLVDTLFTTRINAMK